MDEEDALLVVIDDVYRTDERTLLVLRHLADHILSVRLLLVATCRDKEADSILPRVLPDLLRSPCGAGRDGAAPGGDLKATEQPDAHLAAHATPEGRLVRVAQVPFTWPPFP